MVREFQNSVCGNNCRGVIFIQRCRHVHICRRTPLSSCSKFEKSCSRKPNPVFSVDVIFVNTITADDSMIGAVVFVCRP